MTATSSRNGHAAPDNPEALRQEIARTRTELGETVEALAAKADVKARAQETVDAAKARAHEAVATAKLQVREGVEQAKVNTVATVRELRAHPVDQVRLTVDRLRSSVRASPAPWIVASGLLVLAAFISYRKGQQR
jgi:uncharacterized protein DUF3618